METTTGGIRHRCFEQDIWIEQAAVQILHRLSNYPTGTINLYIELYQNFPRVDELSSICVSTR